MYTYITTYRFIENEADKKHRIYKAYRSYLEDKKAVDDGTTSTSYFQCDEDIENISDEIITHLNGVEDAYDEKDEYIITLLCTSKIEGNSTIISKLQIINGNPYNFPVEIESILPSYKTTVSNFISTII